MLYNDDLKFFYLKISFYVFFTKIYNIPTVISFGSEKLIVW